MVASTPYSLVIVESPTKARKIQQFLGSSFRVEACGGHIRDLPDTAEEVPVNLRKTDWATTGVNIAAGFEPYYVISPRQQQRVKDLKRALANADALILATDGDREGESIAWHLREVLKPSVPVHRLVFHEVTSKAIQQGLQNTRDIDMALVDAQETRRILDRLVGYGVSPLVWKKVVVWKKDAPKLSAGRVQSVAVRLLVERERERMAFRAADWWDLKAEVAPGDAPASAFPAVLVAVDGRRVAKAGDFDPTTGKLVKPDLLHLDEDAASRLRTQLEKAAFSITARQDKPFSTKPRPPFTTSTLQQEGARKFSWTSNRTMRVAQRLYETGYITYMRTDSTNLAADAVAAIRNVILRQYGQENIPPQPRQYRTKTANAQEAHEAIRPAGPEMPLPASLAKELGADELKLYELIWRRTVASQMPDTRGQTTVLTLTSGGGNRPTAEFRASGRIVEFPGHLLAYAEGTDHGEATPVDADAALPAVDTGTNIRCTALEGQQHTTKARGRYTEASLVRALEERGIGRPSTYATAIETIFDREYCTARDRTLIPTWTAIAVTQLLERGLPPIVDYDFTARLEDQLDAISNGRQQRLAFLNAFYHGGAEPGLNQLIESAMQDMQPRKVCTVPLPWGIDVRVGRFGPFVESDGKRFSLPEASIVPPADFTAETLQQLQAGDEPLGDCPETGLPIFLKSGRYGPYLERGSKADTCHKTGSLLKGTVPEAVTPELAARLLALPRTLGPSPDNGEPVELCNGRHGLYLKRGKETRSVANEVSSLDITLAESIAKLAEPKTGNGRRGPATVLKTLGESPATGTPVELKEGRFGPYVTDGAVNASLSQGVDPEGVTLTAALELLAAAVRKKGRKGSRK